MEFYFASHLSWPRSEEYARVARQRGRADHDPHVRRGARALHGPQAACWAQNPRAHFLMKIGAP